MKKFDLTLWTDEMVFTRGALVAQIECHSEGWRRTFIKYDARTASVYIPSIRSCQRTIAAIDKAMPPIGDR